jgi:hypothetical protein
MSRAPVIAFALAALFSAFGAQAASPTQLRYVSLEFDPALFELVRDSKLELGASATLVARDDVAQFSLLELHGAVEFDEVGAISELLEDETAASPPHPVEQGPAGWTCRFFDFRPPGVLPAALMRCAGRQGPNVAILTVMTNARQTSPEMLETLRTMIASLRFKAAR